MTYRILRKEALNRYCRNCINAKYGMKLKRQDCYYMYYLYKCQCCGEMRNIVNGIRVLSRWKIKTGFREVS